MAWIQDICGMHILLAAATTFEIQPVITFLQQNEYQVQEHRVEVLITGIGGMHTTYQLATRFAVDSPDFAIQAGIGGSFSPANPPGSVVLVQQEFNGDLGVWENGQWKDLFDMNLQDANEFPYTNKWLVNTDLDGWQSLGLPFVRSASINEITTNPARMDQLQQNHSVTVEAMEGAAFHYACLQQEVPFLQIRSISNYVRERDKSQWKMKEAIAVLNDQLMKILNSF
jgi:futalosine hydrolase